MEPLTTKRRAFPPKRPLEQGWNYWRWKQDIHVDLKYNFCMRKIIFVFFLLSQVTRNNHDNQLRLFGAHPPVFDGDFQLFIQLIIQLVPLLSHAGAVFHTPSVVPLCRNIRVPFGLFEDGWRKGCRGCTADLQEHGQQDGRELSSHQIVRFIVCSPSITSIYVP